MKKFNLVVIFLFVSVHSLFSQNECSDDYSDHLINRANSMFWLSRARQNSLPEAKKAMLYLDSLESHLKTIVLEPKCKNAYLKRAQAFRIEVYEMIQVTYDNFNGIYPILPFLTNQYDQLEYYDDAIETSLEKALSNLLESGIYKPSKELKDVLLFCVIDSEDQSLKEVAAQYLNNNSRMYVISDHEIKQALGELNLESDSSLHKLGAFFSTNYIGKLVLSEYENSENVAYTGVRFEFYDLANKELISDTYAEGMKVDMKGRSLPFLMCFGLFVLVGIVLAFVGYFFIQKRSSKEIEYKLFLVSALFGLILSIAASIGVVLLFSTFAPSGGDFMGEPGVWTFPYLLASALLLSPVLLFILTGLLLKRMLSDQQGLIFTFLFISLLGITFSIEKVAMVYLQFSIPIIVVLPYLLSSLFVAYFSSSYLADQYRKNKGIFRILFSYLFFLPLIVTLTETMKIGNEISQGIIYISSLLSAVPGVIFVIAKNWKRKELQTPHKTVPGSSVNKLREFINSLLTDQLNGKHVSFNAGYEAHLTEMISSFKGFRHLHLSASSGIGKTTLIKSVLASNKAEIISFYGDCDEIQEGTTVPYEPFYQAFSEHLGEGIFFNGSTAAVDLLQKAKPVLSLAGVGDIADQVADQSNGFNGASTKEILRNILSHLSKATSDTGTRRVVLVIEDLQWIDEYTQQLLIEALRELFIASKKQKNPFDTCIVTSSSGESELMSNILKISRELSENEEGYEYLDWTNDQKDQFDLDQLSANSFVKDLLSVDFSGVLISPNSMNQIAGFVERAEIIKPRYVLEMIKYLLEKELLTDDNGILELDQELDWDTIPFESELEELYREQFNSLPADVLKVLESAAFVGMEFEADLLSKLWKIDRIHLIHNLLKAEKSGIVVDINDHDDYYRFGSKSIRAALKRFSLADQSNKGRIPQIVKEYHREIISITLEKYSDDSPLLKNIPDDVVFSLAERSLLVYREHPEKGQRIISAAAQRSMRIGNLNALNDYLRFLFMLNQDELVSEDSNWELFLRANLLELNSNPSGYQKEFGTVLIPILKNKILTGTGSDLELKCYLELILKIASNDENVHDVLSRYKDHPYSRLYTILIQKENQDPKLFTQDQIQSLMQLQIEFDSVEGHKDLKQQILGILALVTNGDEKLNYLELRMRLLFPEITNELSLSAQLDLIDKTWKTLDFENVENCGFLLSGMNVYFKSKGDKDLIFKLNKIRLSVNERLNHRLGIFLSSLELLDCYDQWSYDEYYDFAEHLFYSYTEGSFRAQIYPCWLSRTLDGGESLDKIALITQSMLSQLKKPDFLSENDKKYVRLPKEKYLELLDNKKIKNANEEEVLKLLLSHIPA